MASTKELLAQVRRGVGTVREFFDRGVWETDYSQHRGVVWFLVRQLQVLLLVVKGVREDQMRIRAASLSLITLLSIVPFLAVVFWIFQAVGGLHQFRARIQGFIFENIAVGSQEQFAQFVDGMVADIHGGAVGGLGTVVLLWASVRLMAAMEESFNSLWGVRRSRPLLGRFVIYWCLLTIGPLLLAASLAGSSWFQTWLEGRAPVLLVQLLDLVPITITIFTFTLLYMVVPNTRVKFRHALIGGFTAGVLFEVAKWGYALVAANLFRYNALYGSLGAIPVFIIWVNIGWTLVLLGCEITFANQSVGALRHEQHATEASQRFRELLAVRLVLEIAVDLFKGQPPPSAPELSKRLSVPVRLVYDVLEVVLQIGLVREANNPPDDPGYVPGRVLEQLSISDVLMALREQKGLEIEMANDDARAYLKELLSEAESAAEGIYGGIDYLTLAKRFAGSKDPDPAARVHPLRGASRG